MKYYKVVLPTKLVYGISKKTKKPHEYSLNLNTYRNTHFYLLNNMKQLFTNSILSSTNIKEISKFNKIFLIYIHHPGRLCDTNNVCSVVDKFFQDTLVKANIIPDDNYKHVVGTLFLPGAVDRKNPRVEVIICGLE